MVEVEVRRSIDLPADAVWEEVRHFDRVLNWIPGGETSTIKVSGSGVGAIRDIQLSTQGYVQHRLVAFEPSQRMFSYELTAGKPIGMQHYVVVARVTSVDDKSCVISWRGKLAANSTLNEEDVAIALKVALDNMATGIVARLKGEQPVFNHQPNEDWQLKQHQS
jgi:hypothetical protein